MEKYAKIIDENSKVCMIGIGDDAEFYKSIGMELMDVEQGHDGQWYLAGYAPVPPPPPETKTVRTFSKFSIWVATQNIPITLPDGTASSVWTAFESFLKNEKMQNGDTLYSGWVNLNDLAEDNEFFEQFYPKAIEAFGKELVDGVLAASVTSTKEVIIEVTPEEPETPENGTETGDSTGTDTEQGETTEPPAETPENGTETETPETEQTEQPE